MKKLMTLAACALALAAARPAHAQEPTPARMHAAEELIASMDMETMYARTMDQMIDVQKRNNPMFSQYESVMRDFFRRYMSWNQMKPDFTRMYAQVYTEDELHQLKDFYATPLGRRLLETMPELTQRSAELSQARVMAHMPELMQAIMQKMQAPQDTAKKP